MRRKASRLVAVCVILSCLVLSSDGDCRWQWSEWSSCNPGFFSNLLFKRDRARLIIQAPVLSLGQRCDFSLNLESPELVTFDGSGLVQSEPCSTRDTATYNGFCVEATKARCANGFCIAKQLVCNQDDDCQDRSDEGNCTQGMRWCNGPDEVRPSHNEWSLGVDLLSGGHRHAVLDTGFNGDCKSMTDGDQRMYRQPFNVFHVSAILPAKEQITVKSFTDYRDFMRFVRDNVIHASQRASIGFTFLPTHKYKTLYVFARLTIATEKVDMKYESDLKPSNQFYMDLHDLPADINNQVYMKFTQKYGTHFWSKSQRGGTILIALALDRCLFDTAREHVELDMVKFLTDSDPPTTLHKRVTEYFKNVTQEYMYITGGHAPHNVITGSGYSVRHMNSTDLRQWKMSTAVSPQILPSDAFESEEPALIPITKLLHKNLLTVRRWDRVQTNLEMMHHRYLSNYDDTALLCPECDGDDVIITPDIYSPAPSRFGCLCVTRDQRLTPVCYPRAEKLEEKQGKGGPGVLDKWVIVALIVICLALIVAIVYIVITVVGRRKEQGLINALNPWKTAPNSTTEHKKLNMAPKPSTKEPFTSAKKALLHSASNTFILPDEEWHVNLEDETVGDITFVVKTTEILLAVTHPYKNKVLIYNRKGVVERDTASYNISLDVPQGITYHRDVEKIVVCEWGGKCVSVLPTTLDAKFRSFCVPSRPWSICPLVDSRLAISTCEQGKMSSILIYSMTGVMLTKFQIHDSDRRSSMEEFGEEHLLVVNWDGRKNIPELKNGRFTSPLKRTKSRNSRRKNSDANDKNKNLTSDNKNVDSPLMETNQSEIPVYAKVNKMRKNQGSIRSTTIPEDQENQYVGEGTIDVQLAVFDKNGQYQWDFREPSCIDNDIQVTSVCVSRLPISDPSWKDPELANLQVLVAFATNIPSQMLRAFSPEGHALDHVKFRFRYETSYGVLRSVSYEEGLVALLFDNRLVLYEGVKMLQFVNHEL